MFQEQLPPWILAKHTAFLPRFPVQNCESNASVKKAQNLVFFLLTLHLDPKWLLHVQIFRLQQLLDLSSALYTPVLELQLLPVQCFFFAFSTQSQASRRSWSWSTSASTWVQNGWRVRRTFCLHLVKLAYGSRVWRLGLDLVKLLSHTPFFAGLSHHLMFTTWFTRKKIQLWSKQQMPTNKPPI